MPNGKTLTGFGHIEVVVGMGLDPRDWKETLESSCLGTYLKFQHLKGIYRKIMVTKQPGLARETVSKVKKKKAKRGSIYL